MTLVNPLIKQIRKENSRPLPQRHGRWIVLDNPYRRRYSIGTGDSTVGYTVRKAAEKLGVTTGRVRQWIADGRLVASPIHPRLSEISARELSRFARIPRRAGRPKKKLSKSC